MKQEKNYVVTFSPADGGYKTTVIVNAYNKEEAKGKIREFVIRNAERNVKPEFLNRAALENEAANLVFNFGVAENTMVDIRC